MENIALVGFMGTGKSCVGRYVAQQLHFDLFDTDEVIELRAGKSISDIFAEDGEEEFRQLERRVVDELAALKRTVISTGGGLVVTPYNLHSLKTHALVVCLWASPEAIWERVNSQKHRPLLQDPDPMSRIRRLLAERDPAYRQADVLINTEMRSVREVAQQVIHQFHFARNHPSVR